MCCTYGLNSAFNYFSRLFFMNLYMFRKFIFLFLFLFTSVNLFGQQVSYLNVSDGLSSRHTYGIEQDKKGFIWIATNEGIDRYDGSEFKSYSLLFSALFKKPFGKY